jgi:hypothetical protein
VSLLLIQYLIVITIGGLLYFLFKENNQKEKEELGEPKVLNKIKRVNSSLKIDNGKSEWICKCGTHNQIDLANCSNCNLNKFMRLSI